MQPVKTVQTSKGIVVEGVTIWDVIKTIVSLAWIPYMTYKNASDNRYAAWKLDLEQRIRELEAACKVQDIQIKTVMDDIKEVKQGVDKLVERLIK